MVLFPGIVLASGCFRSHSVDPDGGAPARDSGPDALIGDAGSRDAARDDGGRPSCMFRYETEGAVATCSVSANAEHTCREVAICLCDSAVDTPWVDNGWGDCVEAALVRRAQRTLADFCNQGLSLGDAIQGFGAWSQAEVTTSPSCDAIPAVIP